MSQLDDLPADQRATLSLILRQGKSYGDVASLLRIDEEVVRERAHAALDALGPLDAAGLGEDRRSLLADYLLGQQSASERADTREFLESSPAARAWARVVASELRELAGDRLPDVPAEGAEVEEAFGALQERTEARERQQKSSRVGGIVLLAGLGALVALVIVLLVSGGGGSKDSGTIGSAGSTGTTSTSSTTPKIDAQVNMVPTQKGSKALGVINLISQGSQRAFAMQAQGLAPTKGFAYAVWLYNSATDAQALGFTPSVKADGKVGPFVAALPSTTSRFHQLILTRETTNRPARPGAIVLAGDLPAS